MGNLTSLFRRRSRTPQGRPRTTAATATTSTSSDRYTTAAEAANQHHNHKTKKNRSSSRGSGSGGEVATSPRRIAPLSTPPRVPVQYAGANHRNRIFFSTQGDDDDDDEEDDETGPHDNYPHHHRDVVSDGSYSTSRPYDSDTGTYETASKQTSAGMSSAGTSSDPAGGHRNHNDDNAIGTILRYRGFSTSIQNLFLDEALVCASMGCFGLILSNRTEYLLQLRNDRRGVRWGRSTSSRTLPSRFVAYALLITLLCIMITFVVWGFGSNNKSTSNSLAEGWYKGYGTDAADDDNNNENENDQENQQQGDDQAMNDDAAGDDGSGSNNNNNKNSWWNYNKNQNNVNYSYNNNNKNYNYRNGGNRALGTATSQTEHFVPHSARGIFKLRDMHEGVWVPAIDYVAFNYEWYHGANSAFEEKETRSSPHIQDGHNLRALAYTQQQRQSSSSRDLASDIRVSFIIAFMIVLGVLGRRRRMRTRYYLVRARAQEDHLFYASAGAGVRRVAFQDSREDQYEGACSHTLCGCYPVDPPTDGDEIDDDVKVNDDGVVQHKKTPQNHDCISLAFNCLMACCCGLLCRCWCQWMSICALAQEAREIRLLVPTRYQRVDYLTHQPFHEYQKSVNELRRGWLGKSRLKASVMPHFQALSRLSRYILVCFFVCFLTITATLMFNPRASFAWPDLVILIATFLQSFVVIFCVHWIFHKSDLSLDAVIKFFATGFLIAVPAAFFFEGMLVNITLTIAYTGYAIGVKISDSFTVWVVDNYKWMWILGELFNAYMVAAITEELCKYYTFRCVEHPDLIFLTGLAKGSQDERAVAGGIVKYPFSANQVEETNKRDAYDDDDDRSVTSRASHRSTGRKSRSSNSIGSSGIKNIDPNPLPVEDEFQDDEQDVRTHRQKAMAVTTGMISVAVGLACAENFLYVFLLGGSEANAGDVQSGGVIEEWIVLLFRSLFPIHALAAAMQSINVIRKYIECDTDYTRRIGVYRIILPAVIMHGSFDAVLLGINIYIETSWDSYLEENEGNFDANHPPYNPILVNLVAWLSLICIMMAGLSWYYHENRQQRQRLIVLEEKEKATMSMGKNYRGPEVAAAGGNHHVSEVELV